ncbi:MAG TPA: transglutaminase-like domain-containing protein [Micromonosporaceae bacterium]
MTEGIEVYRRHTVCTDPGRMTGWAGSSPEDLASARRLATRLVFHFWAAGDPLGLGFTPDRLPEVDLRYAEEQFARLADLTPGLPLEAERGATQRILGCCRDFTLLLVSMLRSHGVAARSRVGHAGYFEKGWWVDHVVAEVYDEREGDWRLVEAQIPDDFPGVGGPLDPLDVPRDRFLTGDAAWIAAREGRLAPQSVVVSPALEIPETRGWPQLAHNLVLDLASLTGWEPLQWDEWGALTADDADLDRQPALRSALDAVADAIAGGADAADLRRLAQEHGFSVPATIRSRSPYDGTSRTVVLRAT